MSKKTRRSSLSAPSPHLDLARAPAVDGGADASGHPKTTPVGWRAQLFATGQHRVPSTGNGLTQRGALAAVAAVGALLIITAASQARLGFGMLGDVIVGLAVVAGLAVIYAVISTIAVRVARRVPAQSTGALVGTIIGVAVGLAVLFGVAVVRPLAIVGLGLVGLWGAVAGDVLAYRREGYLPRRARFRVLAAGLATAGLWFAFARDSTATGRPDPSVQAQVPSTVVGPSYSVQRYRYGSGVDAKREEYGDSIVARTQPLDLTALVPALVSWRQDVHQRYWDFDLTEAPRNAVVWLPEADGPRPVALLIHGVGTDERSEEGLAYLAESLAEAGFAAVSIDANYLSGPWVTGTDGVIAARVALVLGHLETLAALHATDGTPFRGAFDLSRVVLIGHSRGGEAAAGAAMLASFGRRPDLPMVELAPETSVRAVVALAPTDGLYLPGGRGVELQNIPYLLVRGSLDADVPPSAGTGQYERVNLDASQAGFKAGVVIAGANHVQFNARWGTQDMKFPLSWLLDDDAVLPAALQRTLTSVIVRAFLAQTLEPVADPVTRFEAIVGTIAQAHRVPVTLRTGSGRTLRVATFDEDADLSTATLGEMTAVGERLERWTEGTNPRSGNAYLRIGWDRIDPRSPPQYVLRMPSGDRLPLTPGSSIVLNAASLGRGVRFAVELVDADGHTARSVIDVRADPEYTRQVRRWRSLLLDASVVKTGLPAFRTYVVPIASLAPSAAFDLRRVVTLRLVFDGTPSADLLVDDLGIRTPRLISGE